MMTGVLPPLTATQTLDRARAVLQNGRGAGLPELLKIIETASANLGEVTIPELASLIEKDAVVLTRIVQIANTIVHNPGFTPLSTLTHAIHQIGFTRVRSLTLSIMLLENAGARNPPEQRESAALALSAGLLAQGCALQLGNVDPETVFTCVALRHFGQIVLPAVSLEHYRAAQERLADKPEDVAYRGVFGVTPLELSRRVLAGSRLPEEVMRSLRDLTPEAMGGTATMAETRLLAVADFGGRIARLALDGGKGAQRFGDESRALARRFQRVLPDAMGLVPMALEHTDARLAGFLRTGGIASLPTASLNRIRARAQHVAPDSITITPSASEAGPALPAVAVADVPTPPADSRKDAGTLEQVMPEPDFAPVAAAARETTVHESPWFETLPLQEAVAPIPNDPWLAALTLVRDSFGADECWAFTTVGGGLSMPLTHGVGEHWERSRAQAAVRPDERTVAGVCLSRREVVVIHEVRDEKLRPHLPAWLLQAEAPLRSFVLIPLHSTASTRGLVLVGWHEPRHITLNRAQLELARQSLDRATAMIAA